MSITLNPQTEQLVADELVQALQYLREDIIEGLTQIGEKAVNMARSMGTQNPQGSGTPYKMQTGNLNSSVGYCVTENGRIVMMSSFQAVSGNSGDGVEGSMKGRQYAQEIAAQFPQGYALILVAGMHYASYVQELHGRDVLASATLLATKLLEELKMELKQ